MIASTDVQTFMRAYLDCALWLGHDDTREADPNDGSIDLRGDYDLDDLTPETRARVLEDCTAFHSAHYDAIARDVDQAGHDFYLTRNGHGAGFWDGDWPEGGRALTEACRPYGDFTLVLQDDGKIGHWG